MADCRLNGRFLVVCLLVFVLILFLFSKRKLNQSTINGKIDEIQRAVDQIPFCNQRDRPRQYALLKMLKNWSRFARENRILYWISFGTLVGYVQSGGLQPFSTDLSITIQAEDTRRLVKFINKTISKDYLVKVQPDWQRKDYHQRSYYSNDEINFLAPNAQFVDQRETVHIDIYPSYETRGQKGKIISTANLTEYDAEYDWISYPKDWTFPLRTCHFSSIEILCPTNPRKLVENLFGPEALNKSDIACIDGRWV